MILAQYKGRKYLFNRLTCWWLRGKYSHVELIFDDGVSFSSRFGTWGGWFKYLLTGKREAGSGVGYKDIKYSNHDSWDFIYIGKETPEIRARADAINGSLYDTRGLYGMMARRIPHKKEARFCSEAVQEVLGFDDPWRFDTVTIGVVWRVIMK